MNLASEIINLCMQKNITLCANESITGGLILSTLTEVPGSSKVIKGGLVSYQTDIKIKVADVKKDTIKRYGTISYQTVTEMAVNGKNIFSSDICLAITGNAGPTPSDNKAIGEVYTAIAGSDKIIVGNNNFSGNRETIRKQCLLWALDQLKNFIIKNY
jgi:nicotinamide-nucleotide amidase